MRNALAEEALEEKATLVGTVQGMRPILCPSARESSRAARALAAIILPPYSACSLKLHLSEDALW